MKRSARLVSATLLLAFAMGVPMAAQELRYAITVFSFDAQNRQAPKEIEARMLLPRGTGTWILCIYGFNSANKKGSIKYVESGYVVRQDNPVGVDGQFLQASGSLKVRRGDGEAYGDYCAPLFFREWRGLVLYTVRLNLKKLRKQAQGSYGEWGIAAWPGPPEAAAEGLQSSSGVDPSTGPVKDSRSPR